MPQPKDEDDGIGNLIAHFVMPHDDATDFAWRIGIQFLTDAGKLDETIRSMRELLDDMSCSVRGNGLKESVQANKIRRRPAGPDYSHAAGGGSGRSVDRLSAHACMLW